MSVGRITVIVPVKNGHGTIRSVIANIRKQTYKNKEILVVDDGSSDDTYKICRKLGVNVLRNEKNIGLAASLNRAFLKAKTDIVVSLQSDCVPTSKDWLKNLVEPLKNPEVVASVSKVETRLENWKKFGLGGQILTARELGTFTPLMDEKGCAFRRKVMIEIGLFDYKTFRTAGEDFDMYFKLSGKGKIAYPNAKVYHEEFQNFTKRFKKEARMVEGYGCDFRIYGTKMTRWPAAIAKSIPILGWLVFMVTFPYHKLGIKSIASIPINFARNFMYSFYFWRGFIRRKQTRP